MTFPPDRYRLDVTNLTKRYGGNAVVDGLTFTVEPGRVTGFLGPNGSGKSTTMKMLLDLAEPDDGTATIGGVRYRDLPDPAGTLGVVLEPNAFHPGRSGRNHLRILALASGQTVDRVDATLAVVGLTPEAARRRVGTYSLGMKQRLSLAAALLTDPPVLVLDEPANGLDPQGIRELRDLLRGRAARGHTVLVSSHLLTEVQHLVDDVVVIDQGRLVTTGTVDALTDSSARVRTPHPRLLAERLTAVGGRVEPSGRDTLVVSGLDLDRIGDIAHAADIALHELSPHAGSLEDVFLALTAHDPDNSTDIDRAPQEAHAS
ncbi:MAG: ATP-binding cassette domain-containing protein [Ilumatobacter sp.]|uniref:ABC transporter ATP-binding protein n=1 Tax=Ilumatobacter sp. TaxID=1967498 RepID=UPI002609A31A|nr:ATP-binding cassette domain-containing protein [Ilumatobacter sp.]MDJ0767160.1 ATP-binding cassette domain-containing protein [Ilumatobacter sp.]